MKVGKFVLPVGLPHHDINVFARLNKLRHFFRIVKIERGKACQHTHPRPMATQLIKPYAAPFVRMNTEPGERIFNYKFSQWNPAQALAFYSDRFLKYPVNDPEALFEKLKSNPDGTWLSSVSEFTNLEKDFPGKLYLIYGNQRFAYFTSMKNRENVVYDFSSMKLPVVR